MLVTDLIHSCSNDKVAQAATCCIGGVFAERVRAVALENGVSEGRFVAVVVRDFALRADETERAAARPRDDRLRSADSERAAQGRRKGARRVARNSPTM